MYEKINSILVQDLPKAIFNYNGKTFFKTTIYNKIILDLYKETSRNTPSIFNQKKCLPKLGKERPSPRDGSLGFPINTKWTFKKSRRRKSMGR